MMISIKMGIAQGLDIKSVINYFSDIDSFK